MRKRSRTVAVTTVKEADSRATRRAWTCSGSASLLEPHVLAREIADDLRAALEQIEDVLGDLEERFAPATGGE